MGRNNCFLRCTSVKFTRHWSCFEPLSTLVISRIFLCLSSTRILLSGNLQLPVSQCSPPSCSSILSAFSDYKIMMIQTLSRNWDGNSYWAWVCKILRGQRTSFLVDRYWILFWRWCKQLKSLQNLLWPLFQNAFSS